MHMFHFNDSSLLISWYIIEKYIFYTLYLYFFCLKTTKMNIHTELLADEKSNMETRNTKSESEPKSITKKKTVKKKGLVTKPKTLTRQKRERKTDAQKKEKEKEKEKSVECMPVEHLSTADACTKMDEAERQLYQDRFLLMKSAEEANISEMDKMIKDTTLWLQQVELLKSNLSTQKIPKMVLNLYNSAETNSDDLLENQRDTIIKVLGGVHHELEKYRGLISETACKNDLFKLSKMKNQASCPICKDDLHNPAVTKILTNCLHLVCESCIEKWKEVTEHYKHFKCPLCRSMDMSICGKKRCTQDETSNQMRNLFRMTRPVVLNQASDRVPVFQIFDMPFGDHGQLGHVDSDFSLAAPNLNGLERVQGQNANRLRYLNTQESPNSAAPVPNTQSATESATELRWNPNMRYSHQIMLGLNNGRIVRRRLNTGLPENI